MNRISPLRPALGAAFIAIGLAVVPAGFAAGAVEPAKLDAQARDDIARIETYLNDLTTLDSQFVQLSQDGFVEGRLRLSRPGDMRIDYEPPIQAYEIAQNSAIQAAQQAAGMFSIERKDKEAKSGRAIDKLNQEQDLGNYHFADFLDLAVQYEGRVKNEILRHIEDTQGVRGFRGEDDNYKQMQVVPTADPESGELKEHPYGKGRDHDVVVKAGPSMQSLLTSDEIVSRR